MVAASVKWYEGNLDVDLLYVKTRRKKEGAVGKRKKDVAKNGGGEGGENSKSSILCNRKSLPSESKTRPAIWRKL